MDDIFVPEHWQNICKRVSTIAKENIFPYVRSNRVRSGILSELFENQSAEYFTSIGIKTKSCDTDKEPDLTFVDRNQTCEIKVTSSNKQEWMGNHVSKKNSEYVLISWKYTDTLEFSVINVYLSQDDWNRLGNYNGTKINSKTLQNKKIKVLV
jgi:hypothetical protein